MIKVENIVGKLLLIGAEDDCLWPTGKYIRRMQQRLESLPHQCEYEAIVYEHGTHFVLPESMLKMALPITLKTIMGFLFKAAKQYPKECQATRIDIDKRVTLAIQTWLKG